MGGWTPKPSLWLRHWSGSRGPLADYWPPVAASPSDKCVIRLGTLKIIVELLYVSIGIWVCTGFEDSEALRTVIEELVNGESRILTDMSKAQIAGKLSRRRTWCASSRDRAVYIVTTVILRRATDSVLLLSRSPTRLVRGGAPIGAGGHAPPPLFEAKGDGGHNLGIIHIPHNALITPLHQRQRSVVFILACGASRRQLFSDWRPVDSEITAISPV